MDVLHKLGIDGKLLLAQVVNFFILLYVLKRFAYRPMLQFLEERSAKIEKGLQDAENASARLEEAQHKEMAVLKKAQAEARAIVDEALAVAKKRDQEQLAKTEVRVKQMLAEAEAEIGEAKEAMLTEAKQEITGLVVAATKTLLQNKIDVQTDEVVIKNIATS